MFSSDEGMFGTAKVHPKFCQRFVRLQNIQDKRNILRKSTRVKMSKDEDVTESSEKAEGIPLRRAEGLLLVMDTPKGAV